MKTKIFNEKVTNQYMSVVSNLLIGKSSIIMLLFISLVLSNSIPAQNNILPKAEDLFKNYVEKTGGQQVYDGIQNRLTKSKMTISFPPITGEVTSYTTKTGLYNISINTASMGKIEYGSDGNVVWEINPMLGAKVREGQERLRFRSLYNLDLPAQWRTAFKKIECTSLDTIDNKPAYKVIAVNQEDYPLNYFFDKSSGLIVKIELPVEVITGKSVQEIFLSDYKMVDGILFPHIQKRVEQGREMILTFFSVSHNIDIPENIFVLPEAIEKIVGAKK